MLKHFIRTFGNFANVVSGKHRKQVSSPSGINCLYCSSVNIALEMLFKQTLQITLEIPVPTGALSKLLLLLKPLCLSVHNALVDNTILPIAPSY